MSRSALAFCVALLIPVTAVAAAGSGVFGSLEEFSRAVGMKKGGWLTRFKVTMAEIEILPGADPAEVAAVRARIAKQAGTVEEKEQCSDRASTGVDRLPGILLEEQCSYSGLNAADGRWAMRYSCSKATKDYNLSITSQGTYSRRAVTGRHEGEARRKGIVIRFKAETESRFTGKCSGGRRVAELPPAPAADTPSLPRVDDPPPPIILPRNMGR